MTNSHVSYLQTLTKNEAIAFVASLQKVKEHLSQELQWMNEQVQQKTTQIQGIETLLTEATGLGFTSSSTASTTPTLDATTPSEEEPSTDVNGKTLAAETAVAEATSALSPEIMPALTTFTEAEAPRAKQRQQIKTSKSKRGATAAIEKTSGTKTKKSGRSTPSTSEESNSVEPSGFQQFLQAKFRAKSMTDAVGEILENTTEPLNTDAIMAELYDGLSHEAYQRAKSSLSNILSVGKTKGKWKSPGRGLYAGSAIAN